MTTTENTHPDRAVIEARARALAEIDRARAELPPADPALFDCYLGTLVRQVEADTEADPVGILASLVCAAGVYLGPGPHVRTGDDRHPLLVWPLVIGRTNGGRKGASWSTAKRLLVAADGEFITTNVRSGLTSGEGLAAMFAEPEQEGQAAGTPAGPDGAEGAQGLPGMPATEQVRGRRRPGRAGAPDAGRLPAGDRRLLVVEPEWGGVIAKMRREGNSLSATLRQAWEGGDLSTLTVAARMAPESHIGLLAHITPGEFRAKASASDLAGGTYNRFLPVAVSQARFLPGGVGADPAAVASIGEQLRTRLHRARRVGAVGFSPAGLLAWEALYLEFGVTRDQTEAVEQFISRAAPYCLRIAAIHAVLDGEREMTPAHLSAAAALVRYSIASARTVFSDDPRLTRLVAFISEAGPIGRTKTEITTVVFGRNAPAAQVNAALTGLVDAGRIVLTRRAPEGGRGRPVEVYTLRTPE